MSAATVKQQGDRVDIGGELDFDSARRVLAEVSSAIESSASLVIDLGGVTRANSAGLALMIEWLAVARRRGHEVRFEQVPDGLSQLARVCQVESMLAA